MIENYIEKDIVRQVKLTEYLYELKVLYIKEVAKRLNVTFNTIKRDFEKITGILEDYIENAKITSKTIHLSFYSNFTRYDLIKELYKESKFLRVCSRYLMGDTSYITIVEEDFVSVAKAFKIKKEVERYFQHENIMDEHGNMLEKELDIRFVMLSIWMRCDLLDRIIDREKFNLAGIFVNQVLNHLSNEYEMNKREYQFLLLTAYLMVERKDKTTLNYSNEEFAYFKQTSIFNHIKGIAELVMQKQDIADYEIAYFVSVYNSVNFNANNYFIVNMNYTQKRKIFIEHRSKTIRPLIKKLEDKFNVKLLNNILFEKPFMNFLNTLWYNIQNYTVERHYYLSDSQLEIFYKIKEVLNEWKEEITSEYVIEFNDISLEKLCSEIETSLTRKINNKHAILVVAEDELSHVVYRENIARWINNDYIVIDDRMYYSLEEIPVYVEDWPHIIVCERSLISNNIDKYLNLFSISKSTLTTDIKTIFLYLYEY
ncbi:helix-turn-helix domain-containing protein [Enterococcus faecium]|uniref:helix-turn-helix domain-containing protein n=1 Tax=Enterococcus faecium TaxID=1352 RepID=UPI0023E84C87|nr:helix-turn-helix domain-containing protein [Enterococcus faecium]MDF3825437.1 helix-turn-helix domain-containing protein [Enterococcus faecium]